MLWQITFNVLGHCGYEIFPNSFLRSPVGRFLNSPTHHALHHEKFRSNYSLYFNIWDRWCGTNHATYAARFDRATSGGLTPMPLAVTIAPGLGNALPESQPTSADLSRDSAPLPIS
jgi:sterol desaturase/sphingolipid hydroxylase (fatty acid hydroxylase superfamily)